MGNCYTYVHKNVILLTTLISLNKTNYRPGKFNKKSNVKDKVGYKKLD